MKIFFLFCAEIARRPRALALGILLWFPRARVCGGSSSMVYNFVALLVARFVVLAGLLQSLRLMAAADSLSSLPLSIYLSIFLALAPASCTDFRRRCFFFCSLSLVASYQRVFFF